MESINQQTWSFNTAECNTTTTTTASSNNIIIIGNTITIGNPATNSHTTTTGATVTSTPSPTNRPFLTSTEMEFWQTTFGALRVLAPTKFDDDATEASHRHSLYRTYSSALDVLPTLGPRTASAYTRVRLHLASLDPLLFHHSHHLWLLDQHTSDLSAATSLEALEEHTAQLEIGVLAVFGSVLRREIGVLRAIYDEAIDAVEALDWALEGQAGEGVLNRLEVERLGAEIIREAGRTRRMLGWAMRAVQGAQEAVEGFLGGRGLRGFLEGGRWRHQEETEWLCMWMEEIGTAVGNLDLGLDWNQVEREEED